MIELTMKRFSRVSFVEWVGVLNYMVSQMLLKNVYFSLIIWSILEESILTSDLCYILFSVHSSHFPIIMNMTSKVKASTSLGISNTSGYSSLTLIVKLSNTVLRLLNMNSSPFLTDSFKLVMISLFWVLLSLYSPYLDYVSARFSYTSLFYSII